MQRGEVSNLADGSKTAPWQYEKPDLDFEHKYRGYAREIKSLAHSWSARLGGDYSDPEHRFVIFGRGRSGSTLLVRMLDQHTDIACFGELLRSRLVFPKAYRDRCMRLSNKPVRGFKLLSYQMTQVMGISPQSGYLKSMQDEGFRIIYVHRDNYLRLAVSNIFARLRGSFHVEGDAARNRAEMSYEFAPDEVINWMEGAERRTEEEREFLRDIDYFDVLYERDLEQANCQSETVDRLFEWLGVPGKRVSTNLAQATPRDLRTIVANFDEVEAAVAATPFARFLPQQTS